MISYVECSTLIDFCVAYSGIFVQTSHEGYEYMVRIIFTDRISAIKMGLI